MQSNDISLLHQARSKLYERLKQDRILAIVNSSNGLIANIADKSSRASRDISLSVFEALNAPLVDKKVAGQSAGKCFEYAIRDYLQETFPNLQNIRPGKWFIKDLGNRNHVKLSDFAQYEHLHHLTEIANKDSELAAALGNDYMIAPDIIIARDLYTDAELNAKVQVVDPETSTLADIRRRYEDQPLILHASVSAKWTMRTDRAQNTRTEALNLIRNRKGSLPHSVAVTAECLPNRLSSLALGTGDIDCVYHIALYELKNAVYEYARKEQAPELREAIDTLIDGHRLKDITDLPLDLGI